MTGSVLRGFFLNWKYIAGRPDVSAFAGGLFGSARLLNTALIAGCAIAIAIAGYLGDPIGFTHADPDLAQLLRGMALLKGVIAIAIVAAAWWRFSRPVSKMVAPIYLLGSWMLMGSTVLIWQLSWIPLAAILFHMAALSMLLASRREP